MTAVPSSTAVPSDYRARLLGAMARAVAARGYADVTIADIVREASVSRRTFYEHFTTKAECLMALYESASAGALRALQEALDPSRQWQDQVERAVGAYIHALAQNPVLLRTLLIEILGLGAPGLAVRRRVNQQIADFMLGVAQASAPEGRAAKPSLTPDLAVAVVGGINELILRAIEQDRIEDADAIVQTAAQLVLRVVGDGRALQIHP